MCAWTPQPKHQPPQPSHDATHTTCSLSFHPLAIHTLHNTTPTLTPCDHACVLWCLLFACRCLCVLLSARSFLTQPKPRHTIQSPNPLPHMAPPTHEPMNEWEGAAVCVWTPQPKHQPPQPSHDATHTTCSLSFHPLAIHILHNTTPTLTPCDRTCPTPTHLQSFQQHTGFEAHT